MAKGILLVAFDYTNAHEDEFHDWHDLEHVPERRRVPGFGLCERWISVANPKHAVASYDLDSLSVLQSEPYKAIAHENLGRLDPVERRRDLVRAGTPQTRRCYKLFRTHAQCHSIAFESSRKIRTVQFHLAHLHFAGIAPRIERANLAAAARRRRSPAVGPKGTVTSSPAASGEEYRSCDFSDSLATPA